MTQRDQQPKGIKAIEALGPGTHQIDHRLYLKVVRRKSGLSRIVLMRWHAGGRPQSKSLGRWQPERYGHFLAEAQRAGEAILQDRDVRLTLEERGAPGTFQQAAEGFMADNLPAINSKKHKKRWRKMLEATYPAIGHLKIVQLEPGHIAKVLAPDWLRTPVQVMRKRGMIEQVLNYAIARGNLKCGNVAALSLVRHRLPRQPRRLVEHMRALAYEEVPALYKELEGDGYVSAWALMFVLLTVGRSSEVRTMRWPEVNQPKAIWTCPRTKMIKAHRVALSEAALSILDRVEPLRQSADGYVFPGRMRGRPYSANMLRHAMKRVGFDDQGVPHGLRSSFKDWARETQKFEWEAVELCLAHDPQGDVERVYGRSDLLHLRKPIMQAWGRFVTGEPLAPAADLSTRDRPALRLVEGGLDKQVV